jgi:large subunit ribosomal protein L14e
MVTPPCTALHLQCIIDGPETDESTTVERQKINYRRLSLTDHKIAIPRNATFAQMKAAFEEANVLGKWNASSWAKKRASKLRRASLTDFERFKVVVLRKKKAAAIKKALN